MSKARNAVVVLRPTAREGNSRFATLAASLDNIAIDVQESPAVRVRTQATVCLRAPVHFHRACRCYHALKILVRLTGHGPLVNRDI